MSKTNHPISDESYRLDINLRQGEIEDLNIIKEGRVMRPSDYKFKEVRKGVYLAQILKDLRHNKNMAQYRLPKLRIAKLKGIQALCPYGQIGDKFTVNENGQAFDCEITDISFINLAPEIAAWFIKIKSLKKEFIDDNT